MQAWLLRSARKFPGNLYRNEGWSCKGGSWPPKKKHGRGSICGVLQIFNVRACCSHLLSSDCPSLILSSGSCFCPVLTLWNLTKTCISLISGNSHTCFSLIFKDMRTKSGGISRVVHKLVPTWPRFEGKHWKESMMSEFVSVLSAQSKHRNSATGLFLCVPDPRTPFA